MHKDLTKVPDNGLEELVGNKEDFECIVTLQSDYIGEFYPSGEIYKWPPNDYFSKLTEDQIKNLKITKVYVYGDQWIVLENNLGDKSKNLSRHENPHHTIDLADHDIGMIQFSTTNDKTQNNLRLFPTESIHFYDKTNQLVPGSKERKFAVDYRLDIPIDEVFVGFQVNIVDKEMWQDAKMSKIGFKTIKFLTQEQ